LMSFTLQQWNFLKNTHNYVWRGIFGNEIGGNDDIQVANLEKFICTSLNNCQIICKISFHVEKKFESWEKVFMKSETLLYHFVTSSQLFENKSSNYLLTQWKFILLTLLALRHFSFCRKMSTEKVVFLFALYKLTWLFIGSVFIWHMYLG
jgi:hypothetical protein